MAELEYPQFELSSIDAGPLNDVVLGRTTAALEAFAAASIESAEARQRQEAFGFVHQLNSSFEVTLLTSEVVSIRFVYIGFSGGAHGFRYTEVLNVELSGFDELSFADLFNNPTHAVSKVSEFVIRALLDPADVRHPKDEDSIRSGAGAAPENFRSFNLTPYGLLLTFDEYHVGAYSEGSSEVLMPWTALYPLLGEPVKRVFPLL